MKKLGEIKDIYSVCLGSCPGGWYGCGWSVEDVDVPYIELADSPFFDDETMDMTRVMTGGDRAKKMDIPSGWRQAVMNPARRLIYFEENGMERILDACERIGGPALPEHPVSHPAVVWSRRRSGRWELMVYDGRSERCLMDSECVIATPSVTEYEGHLFISARHKGKTEVFLDNGQLICKVPGKFGRMAADGRCFIMVTECPGSKEGTLELQLFDLCQLATAAINNICILGDASTYTECDREIKRCILNAGELNMGAYPIISSGRALIAFESRPSWGMDHCLTMTNSLQVWTWEPTSGVAAPLSYFPVESVKEGFYEGIGIGNALFAQSIHMGNVRLHDDGKSLRLFAKRYRADGFRKDMWDICVSEYDGHRFSSFFQISEEYGAPDTDYSVTSAGSELLVGFSSYKEADLSRSHDYKAIIGALDRHVFTPVGPNTARRSAYQWEPSAAGISSDPHGWFDMDGYTFLTGDLHTHSSYSKCMSGIDGCPAELMRWYMDILRMDVVTISEHLDRTSHVEYTWIYDTVEALAAEEHVVIYSNEPSVFPDHDTNYYTIRREWADLARLVPIYSVYRKQMYEGMKMYMPADAVMAIRHCHGHYGASDGVYSQASLDSFDPVLEPAMEALQLRGNIILGQSNENPQQKFPCNFLDQGYEFGLVGGTDHNLNLVCNHLGFTGFWVKERTAAGVFEAIKNHRTVAISNGKVILWTDIEGKPMGSGDILCEDRVSVHIKASVPREIKAVGLIRNGKALGLRAVGSADFEGILTDIPDKPGKYWYCVQIVSISIFNDDNGCIASEGMRMETPEGVQERNEYSMAFSSPHFVELV